MAGGNMQFVLDCSVSTAWCFSDEKNDYVDGVLESFTHGYRALAPDIWYEEMINVFRSAEKRDRITRASSEHLIRMLSALPIFTVPKSELLLDGKLLYIAGLYDLSAYDACYLRMALEYSLPLATQDTSLKRTCNSAGVSQFLR